SRVSPRNTAVQLGSTPTSGTPSRRYGASVSTVRRSTRRAMSSWPVEVQVGPQQSWPGGRITPKPAAASTPTAAAAVPRADGTGRRPGRAVVRAGADAVRPAAEWPGRTEHAETRRLPHTRRGGGDARGEVRGARVRPQPHRAALAGAARRTPAKPPFAAGLS